MGYAGYLEDIQDVQIGEWRRIPAVRANGPQISVSSKSAAPPPQIRTCPICRRNLAAGQVHPECIPDGFLLLLNSMPILERDILIRPSKTLRVAVQSGKGNLTITRTVGGKSSSERWHSMGGLTDLTDLLTIPHLSDVRISWEDKTIELRFLTDEDLGNRIREIFEKYNGICLQGGGRVELAVKELEREQKALSGWAGLAGNKFLSYFKGALYDSDGQFARASQFYQGVYSLNSFPLEDVFSINNFLMALTSIRLVNVSSLQLEARRLQVNAIVGRARGDILFAADFLGHSQWAPPTLDSRSKPTKQREIFVSDTLKAELGGIRAFLSEGVHLPPEDITRLTGSSEARLRDLAFLLEARAAKAHGDFGAAKSHYGSVAASSILEFREEALRELENGRN